MKKLKSPIPWIGGKYRISKKIISCFPDHVVYVEIFGGGGSILFNKYRSEIEIYNDINNDLVNFFNVIKSKDKFKKFYEIINLIPYSRQEYYENKSILNKGSDIEKAIKFFIIARMCFSGDINGGWKYNRFKSTNNKSFAVDDWLSTIKLLPEISIRLKDVQIINRDYKMIMKYFDDPKIFIYADPPYLNIRSKNLPYKIWSENEHNEFLNLVLKSKCKIMISGYDSELYDQKLKDWNKKSFKSVWTVTKSIKKKRNVVRENIWMNYYNKNNLKDKTLSDF